MAIRDVCNQCEDINTRACSHCICKLVYDENDRMEQEAKRKAEREIAENRTIKINRAINRRRDLKYGKRY